MILPSKHLSHDRALLTVGAHVLTFLTRPKTVSALWEDLNSYNIGQELPPRRITYDWFLLSLDVLYIIGIIELKSGLVARRKV